MRGCRAPVGEPRTSNRGFQMHRGRWVRVLKKALCVGDASRSNRRPKLVAGDCPAKTYPNCEAAKEVQVRRMTFFLRPPMDGLKGARHGERNKKTPPGLPGVSVCRA